MTVHQGTVPRAPEGKKRFLSTGGTRLDWIALGFLTVLLLVAVLAPWLAPHPPNEQSLDALLKGPSAAHPLGTDDLGRDVLSRLIYGARMSLMAALLACGVALVIGLPIGLIAGTFGGIVDGVLMRIVDAMLAFPSVVLALAVVGALGPGLRNAMIAVGVVYSPRLARLLRAQVKLTRSREYVEAAILSGMRMPSVMARHLLPNSLRPVIVQFFLLMSFAFLAEAGLSFLGLGVQPPDASWGHMLARAYRNMTTAGWQVIAPGLAITFCVLALNQTGDLIARVLSRGRDDL